MASPPPPPSSIASSHPFTLPTTIDINTQTLLLHASNHDIPALKPLLRIPGNASVQDPETGCTPLHAAVAACGECDVSYTPGGAGSDGKAMWKNKDGDEVDLNAACDTVRELLAGGAIWNDLDMQGETPGCVAWRLGWRELYVLCVEAGVRAEVLLGIMGGYEELEGESESDEEDVGGEGVKEGDGEKDVGKGKRDVNSKDYLASSLTLSNGNLLDGDSNGVMMTWETSIMEQSVQHFLPAPAQISEEQKEGLRILNIGFGLGIIDGMFAALDPKPHTHHIIEAHPDVLASVKEPASKFGSQWEASAPEGRYKIFPGKWQDIIPSQLLPASEKYDIIYFDTFGESYTQLKIFFQDYVPELLAKGGNFGFFNGLGADRRVCYDVYQNVVEIDLMDSGMDVEWVDVPVGEEVCGRKEGEGEWEGVRRRYWVLDTYRLPVIRVVDEEV